MKPELTLDEAMHLAAGELSAGRFDSAADLCRQILAVKPGHPDAHYLLARAERERGNFAESELHSQQAIAADASRPHYHFDLAQTLAWQNKLAESLAPYREAARLLPNFTPAHLGLGEALLGLGRFVEAEAALRLAVRHEPASEWGHYHLGRALRHQNRLAESRASYLEAIRLKEDFVDALINLASVLGMEGNDTAAIDTLRRAIDLDDNHALAHFNLAMLLSDAGKLEEALFEYQTTVRLQPQDAEALTELGIVLRKLNRNDEAIAALEQAIAINPALAAAQANLGTCLQTQGRVERAIEAFRAAILTDPSDSRHHSNLLYQMNFRSEFDAQTVAAEHRRWGERHADPLTAQALPHRNSRDPERRLRVGYFSAHFRTSSINVFAEPILTNHDRERFEVFCYNNLPASESDAATRRLLHHVDRWRDIYGRGDPEVAQAIRDDEIDILVDLVGHIGGERLLVFARKPAPIQVTYLGYQNTTGMAAMDYRLTDEWCDPTGKTDRDYTEKLVRLPNSFFCYRPSDFAPAVSTLPAESNGYVTFGSFNNNIKVTPKVIKAWAEILRAAPDSRLLMFSCLCDSVVSDYQNAFAAEQIGENRLTFFGEVPTAEFFQRVATADLALDTFPFNGHTTNCDCLWMGLPVVCLVGDRYASRFGSSALHTLGLNELIASSVAQYVQTAIGLGNDLPRLATDRAELRERMQDSPLSDGRIFTRNLEAAYRDMWRNWCSRTT